MGFLTITTQQAINIIIYYSLTTQRFAYEGDGKTSVRVLNKELDRGLMIDAYSQAGFRLNNGINVVGPMAIFPRTVLSWNVGTADEINEASLSLFAILEPKVDILVLGVGDEKITPAFSKKIIEYMRKHRINVEVLSTEQACTTFNFLNHEGRVVAGALIPPKMINVFDDDLMLAQGDQRLKVFDLGKE